MSCCDQAPAWLCSEVSPEPRGSRRPPPGHRRPSAAGPRGSRGPPVTARVHLLSGPRRPPLSDHELLFVERKEASETGGWAPRSPGRCPAGPWLLPPLLTVRGPGPSCLRPLPAPAWRLSTGPAPCGFLSRPCSPPLLLAWLRGLVFPRRGHLSCKSLSLLIIRCL